MSAWDWVLTYEDLGLLSAGGMLSMAGHAASEVLAASAAIRSTIGAASDKDRAGHERRQQQPFRGIL